MNNTTEKIIINNLGPLKSCELYIKDFMVFTGQQASGKSTIAKSIFFFKNIKNLLISVIKKQIFFSTNELSIPLKDKLIKEIRLNFLQVFGSTWGMPQNMTIFYYYDEKEKLFIKISLKKDNKNPNYIWIDFSDNLTEKIYTLENLLKKDDLFDSSEELKKLVNNIFKDEYDTIYIPAGRSMITLLSSQLNYIYSSMEDIQKKSIDYCTQSYLENILKLKVNFNSTLENMIKDILNMTTLKIDINKMNLATNMIKKILKGDYININGEERLQLFNSKGYVKINFASSGQQEVLWILNTLFFYLLNNKKASFIIEEPESNLFPSAQKLVIEFVSMIQNSGNKILLTTHSPYVLGTLNNLLFAQEIYNSNNSKKELLNKILKKDFWIDYNNFSSYFLKNGISENCFDNDGKCIKNEVIDEVSMVINEEFDKLLEIGDV